MSSTPNGASEASLLSYVFVKSPSLTIFGVPSVHPISQNVSLIAPVPYYDIKTMPRRHTSVIEILTHDRGIKTGLERFRPSTKPRSRDK
jgi:hypothetical protein